MGFVTTDKYKFPAQQQVLILVAIAHNSQSIHKTIYYWCPIAKDIFDVLAILIEFIKKDYVDNTTAGKEFFLNHIESP